MSPSELAAAPRAPAPTSFLVTSDPTVQITIYDATRTLRGQAEGSLRLLLVPGLYRVHLERGGRVHHEIVDHETGTDLRHVGPALHSPVPFAGAATSHEYHTAPAERCSVLDTAPPLGPGPHDSRLFVFVRRAAHDSEPRSLPSEPVTIHDAEGRELTAITGDNAEIDHSAGYVAYACRATPGTYRLRASRSQRDATIVVPAGRAAQVFVADTGSLRLAELRLALVPVGARFDPRSLIWGAMEGVIAALRVPDRPLPLAARAMLPDAIDHDLCFGLAAAHVLWRSGDRAGLAVVMRHLAEYRAIPDVAILNRLEVASAGAHESRCRSPAGLADTPPLLRASLTLAMTRPEIDPGTLSAYSAFAHAARTAVHDSVWCLWSTRTWDERWIEPAVERLREADHRRDASAIARSLALATETVEQAIEALDATAPSVLGRPLDVCDLAIRGYALEALLGRGARSAVYDARRQADGQAVALKIVPVPGGADACTGALRALDRCPATEHPALLAATARGTLPGGAGIWLEIERCDGSVLDRLSENDAPLAPCEAHRLVLDALAVLAHLHERSIAHGDLKPSNLLLRGDGSVAIAGPGLAVRRSLPDEPLCATDAPRLAPPELLRDGPETLTSDVWAMAAIYYLLLTLEYPRDEYADQSQLEAALNNPIVSIARRRPELPAVLTRCIDAALSSSPEARPRDAAAFRALLGAIDVAAVTAQLADDAPGQRVEPPSADRAVVDAPETATRSASLAVKPARNAPGPSVKDGAPTDPAADTGTGMAPVASARRDVTDLRNRGVLRSLLAAAHTFRGRVSMAVAAVAITGSVVWSITSGSSASCERDPRIGDPRYRSEACLASYHQAGSERDLALAASAYLELGALDRAEQLAHQLVPGSRQGDAYAILGQVALQRDAVRDATTYATLASASHIGRNDGRALLTDAMLLFQASARAQNSTAALNAADEAAGLARRLHDPHGEVTALLARADTLRELGDLHGAEAALLTASGVATSPCDRASSHLKHASYLLDAGTEELALTSLAVADEASRTCGDRNLADSVALSEAWALRRRDPDRARDKLDAVARSSGERPESLVLRSYLAADRDDLVEAERRLETAEQLPSDPRWTWKLAQARAELSELLDDTRAAERYYRKAVTAVAALRVPSREPSGYFIASHRAPYDGLVALLARQGRWREALTAILALETGALHIPDQDRRARSGNPLISVDSPAVISVDGMRWSYTAPGLGDSFIPALDPDHPAVASFNNLVMAYRAQSLWGSHEEALVEQTALDARRAPPPVGDVIAAWHARDLIIVIAPPRHKIGSGPERAYRIRIAHGEVSGQDIGEAGRATQLAMALFKDPADRDAARALGPMMIPEGTETGTLHVLAIGALGRAPLAALRDSTGSLTISRRPLARVLALEVATPQPAASGRPVILGDPLGDLPGAAAERAIVAQAVGPNALVAGASTSVAATRSLLWTARDAELLHVAGATFTLGRSRALRLADGTVEPGEIRQRGVAPRIAVLTGSSAAAMDDDGRGSFASELLDAGTEVVIATDRNVEDEAALSLMKGFYAQSDWRTHPERALARVQLSLEAGSAPSTGGAARANAWTGFCVLRRPPFVPPPSRGAASLYDLETVTPLPIHPNGRIELGSPTPDQASPHARGRDDRAPAQPSATPR